MTIDQLEQLPSPSISEFRQWISLLINSNHGHLPGEAEWGRIKILLDRVVASDTPADTVAITHDHTHTMHTVDTTQPQMIDITFDFDFDAYAHTIARSDLYDKEDK